MGAETKKRIGKLYAEGKWRQDDEQAKAWAEELTKPKEEPKTSSKKK